MQWTSADLFEALKRYEHECETAGCAPHTVDSTADMRDDSWIGGLAKVASALPGVQGYRGLLNQVQASLAQLSVRIFLVGPGGSVRELVTKPA